MNESIKTLLRKSGEDDREHIVALQRYQGKNCFLHCDGGGVMTQPVSHHFARASRHRYYE